MLSGKDGLLIELLLCYVIIIDVMSMFVDIARTGI